MFLFCVASVKLRLLRRACGKCLWKSDLRMYVDLHEYKKLEEISDSLEYFKASASVPVFLARKSIFFKISKSPFHTHLPVRFLIFLFPVM